jgi:hypothetical protein
MKVYAQSGWTAAGSSVNGTADRFNYTATAGQTTFTGADDNNNTLAYDAGFADIYMNGVKLAPADYTANSGSSVILASGAALNDTIEIIAYGTFTLANHSLNDLTDVTTTNNADHKILTYNVANQQFEPRSTAVLTGLTMQGNAYFGDNDAAYFGDGLDSYIYHDGTSGHTYFRETGSGSLVMQTNTFVVQNAAGTQNIIMAPEGTNGIDFSYNGSVKLSTASTGINVTGSVNLYSTTPIINLTDTDTGADHQINASSGVGNLAINVDTNGEGSNAGLVFRVGGVTSANEYFRLASNGDARFYDSSSNVLLFVDESGGVVINDNGVDKDFRVESNNNANMLFVDAGADAVCIGTNSPDPNGGVMMVQTLNTHASGPTFQSTGTTQLWLKDSNATSNTRLWGFQNSGGALNFLYADDDKTNNFRTPMTMYRGSTGVVINEDSHDQDFRVESNAHSDAFFVNAGANEIGFFCGGGFGPGGMINIDNTGNAKNAFNLKSTTNNYAMTLANTSNGSLIWFSVDGSSPVGSITGTSSGVTYATTSDARLKDNIETITDGTDKLMAMNPVTHTWKADPEAPAVHGFIAQEMQEIVPEAVSGDPDGEEMMSMDYGRITPVLVAALQDAMKEITALKERVAELEAK